MMLLAEISTLGLLAMCALGTWVFLRLLGGKAHQHQHVIWKVLSFAAVGMGLWLFLARTSSHAPQPVEVVDITSSELTAEPGIDRPGLPELRAQSPPRQHWAREITTSARVTPRWSIIVLGSMLVILGALVFGREKTRPGAFKLATFLGIGAIIYLVGTFVGDPPRLPRANVVDVRHEVAADEVESDAQVRTGHARRPTIRPRRPLADAAADNVALPPRAAGIPVAAELAKAPEVKEPTAVAANAEPAAAVTIPPAVASPAEPAAPAEPAPPAEAAAPAEPAPAEASAPAEPAPAVPVTEPTVAEPKPEIKEPTVVVTPPAVVVPTVSTPVKIEHEPRPDWVDAPARLNQGGIYTMPVRSGLFVSVPECQRELDAEVNTAVAHYIDEYLADLSDHASALVDLPLPYLKKHVVKASYAEMVESESVGPMHQIHARLEFDEQVRADVRRRLHDTVVEQRLWYAGGGAALVLALLATFYGYLKLDLWAGEGARARLQLAATLVALLATAGVLLVRYSVPF